MPEEKILLILSDPETGHLLERAALRPAGYDVTLATGWQAAGEILRETRPDLIIISDKSAGDEGLERAASLLERYPHIPIILLPNKHSDDLALRAFRQGFADYLQPPVRIQEVLQVVQRALQRKQNLKNWARMEARRDTQTLQERLYSLEALQKIGRKITSSLDLDSVLSAVVDAAVALTGAEEGSLLLLDENSGELYMRAARNFHDDFVRTFRLPVQDTLAGQVIQTGKPLLIDAKTPQKIKTAYLIYTLIYVPLLVQDRVIGVLEVDNRQSNKPFNEYHVTLVSALADYAAIAIENARLFSRTEIERNKLETILAKIEEGVIVIDHDQCLLLVNNKAREAFGIKEENLTGRRIQDVIQNMDLLEVLEGEQRIQPIQLEITLEDERTLNAQFTPIPEVGLAITMQDITHLKEIDRIKSDFVNTVSHDLRSPLTAILGYVELIERVGPVNEQQQEFIQHVRLSVHNITTLIDDLLDLGRIEAGFDTRKEVVPISIILQFALDSLRNHILKKKHELSLDVPENLPEVLGNPIRLRQMLSNLIGNAIKYTPAGGKIWIRARAKGNQVILEVADNGPGIPPADQPFIFDKFYRGSNIPEEATGTGLGLAIVKSIVENHQGRIWVDSTLGKGSTFMVVLPIADRSNQASPVSSR